MWIMLCWLGPRLLSGLSIWKWSGLFAFALFFYRLQPCFEDSSFSRLNDFARDL